MLPAKGAKLSLSPQELFPSKRASSSKDMPPLVAAAQFVELINLGFQSLNCLASDEGPFWWVI